MRVLVVKGAFGGHSRGSVIKDRAEITKVLAGENAHHVIQSEHPDDMKFEDEPEAQEEE